MNSSISTGEQSNATDLSPFSKCISHENCTSNIFTLYSYCCESTEICCNWLQFAISHSKNSSRLPFKAPSIFTMFTSLLTLVSFLLASYCVCMLFCYMSKCGLFRVPKILVITELSASNNGYDESASGESSGSPKHSSSSSSSSSSSNSSSPAHYRRQTAKSRTKSSSGVGGGRVYRPKRNTIRLPTERATSSSSGATSSNHRRQQHRSSANFSSNARNSNLYAEPECYIDFDNDSPFLLPPSLTQKTNQPKSSRTMRTNGNSSRSSSRSGMPSTSSGSGGGGVSRSRQQAQNSSGTERAINVTNSIQASRDETSAPSSAFLNANQLDTIHSVPGSSSASARSSVSLDFGASLMETVEIAAAESGILLSNANVAASSTNLNMEEEEVNLRSSHAVLSIGPNSCYQDEKPPSYEDIIRNQI